MQRFEVWLEGYWATGMEDFPAPARKLGEVEAETFRDACVAICSPPEWQEHNGDFDVKRLTVWNCRLFDNEADARRSFG